MVNIVSGQQPNTIILEDNETLILREDIIAPEGDPAVNILGDQATLNVTTQGSISAPDPGNTAVLASGSNDFVINRGEISGANNGISTTGNNFRFLNIGQIDSDSRAVDLSDGDGISVRNFGKIVGTGDQRNGTLYVDGTVDDLRLFNSRQGSIDAGEGNLGDGISIQVGTAEDLSNDDIRIINNGLVQGRGDGPEVFADGARVGANGSSGLRFFNGAQTDTTVTGFVRNNGEITSEATVGFLGGLVVEDGVAFEGNIENGVRGEISGPRNGLYIGNAQHDLSITNRGLIESGSRAVNIDGSGVNLRNDGEILGTGSQRNGTIYTDATATDYVIVNGRQGVIDAGVGNEGTGISLQVGDIQGDVVTGSVVNEGRIQGRGDANGNNLEGDGIRLNTGAEGTVTLEGNLKNSGTIIATDDGIDLRAGVQLDGNIYNRGRVSATDTGILLDSVVEGTVSNYGEISGGVNGISSTGNDLRLLNFGSITSDSRAVDLSDGDGIVVRNSGQILGTDNQRNGTLYVDGTVDDLRVVNTARGVIDAGEGNLGDGISIQVGATDDPGNDDINLVNRGLIQGRGDGAEVFADGARVAANGSSGVRFFNGSGETETTVTGNIFNSGTITSEVNVGFLGGIVFEDGVGFEGHILNTRGGRISGPRNGLYVGNADHDLRITNLGEIASGSRAVNLDGDNVSLRNAGSILGTDDQRNGTVYVDGTGDNIDIVNSRAGTIDAGEGNSGSGVSVQVGAVSNDEVDSETSVDIRNRGLIQGRGDANVPAGIRFFVGSGLEEATLTGNVINQSTGVVTSETDAGLLIESGVIFEGQIINDGTIEGGNGFAINAEGALGSIDVKNRGTLGGEVQLGDGNDSFIQFAQDDVTVDGGAGHDRITGGTGSDSLSGGLGNDLITGGQGKDVLSGGLHKDTFVFSAKSGVDIVTDFATSEDRLDVSAIFDDINDILGVGGAATQVATNTLIDFGSSNEVLLLNVDVDDLSSDNFIL